MIGMPPPEQGDCFTQELPDDHGEANDEDEVEEGDDDDDQDNYGNDDPAGTSTSAQIQDQRPATRSVSRARAQQVEDRGKTASTSVPSQRTPGAEEFDGDVQDARDKRKRNDEQVPPQKEPSPADNVALDSTPGDSIRGSRSKSSSTEDSWWTARDRLSREDTDSPLPWSR